MIKRLYPNGKKKVFNLTYDDGVLQDREFIQLLNKYGIKGTFNLNSELMKQEFAWIHPCGMVVKRLSCDAVQGLYDGHEIASHTLTHPNLQGMSAEQILRELSVDRDQLEDIFGIKISGFAVPFNYFSDLIAECAKIVGFEYARTSDMTGGYTPSEDVYHWQAGIFHLSPELDTYVDVFLETDEELACCQIVGHSYDFDAARRWEHMERLLFRVAGHEEVWYATHVELVRYLKAMKKAVISESSIRNLSDRSLWFEIDGKVVEITSDSEYKMEE